jgi:hypothetical protein
MGLDRFTMGHRDEADVTGPYSTPGRKGLESVKFTGNGQQG